MVLSLVATLILDCLREDARLSTEQVSRLVRYRYEKMNKLFINGANHAFLDEVKNVEDHTVESVINQLNDKNIIKKRWVCNPNIFKLDKNKFSFFFYDSYDYPDDSSKLYELCKAMRSDGLNITCYGLYGGKDFMIKFVGSDEDYNKFRDAFNSANLKIYDEKEHHVEENIYYWGYKVNDCEVISNRNNLINIQREKMKEKAEIKKYVNNMHLLGYRVIEDHKQSGSIKSLVHLRPRRDVGDRAVFSALNQIESILEKYSAKFEGLYKCKGGDIILEVVFDWFNYGELHWITNITSNFPAFESITYHVAEIIWEDIDYLSSKIGSTPTIAHEDQIRGILLRNNEQIYDNLSLEKQTTILGDFNRYTLFNTLSSTVDSKMVSMSQIIAAKNEYINGLVLNLGEQKDKGKTNFIRVIRIMSPELDKAIRVAMWRIVLNVEKKSNRETSKILSNLLGGKDKDRATFGEYISAIKKWDEMHVDIQIIGDEDAMKSLTILNEIRNNYIHDKKIPKFWNYILQDARYVLENIPFIIRMLVEIVDKLSGDEFTVRPRAARKTALEYIEESNARRRDFDAKTESSGQKQVFISYKKTDQKFADEVVSYLSEFYRDEFEILYDEFEVVAGDSLPKALNTMLDRSETSMMVWSPDYFSESGWATVEKDGILSKRVREGKRFVPLFLRGKSSIIPTLFSQYVYVDFKEYEKNKNPVLFRKQMEKVIAGLRKEA